VKSLFKQPPINLRDGEANEKVDREVGQELQQRVETAADKVGSKEPVAGPSGAGQQPNSSIPLTDRVNQFLGKAKDKSVAEIRSRMGKDMLVYEAISASNARATNALNLLGIKKNTVPTGKSFIELGDGRIMSGGLQLDMSNKRIVCTSFNAEWICLRCPAHKEPALKMRGAANSSCSKQALS
jgi:hypothetical protein